MTKSTQFTERARSSGIAQVADDGLQALRTVANRRAQRPAELEWRQGTLAKTPPAVDRSLEHVGGYAAPLSPLRERDVHALKSLFDRTDMYAIEADLSQRLLTLLPEPCWEEDAFDFLKEFL